MSSRMTGAGPRGFTLVELIIAMAIFTGVLGGAYAIFRAQQRSSELQEQLVEIQQSARTFLYYMEKDLRAAGFDPTKECDPVPGFLVARPTEAVFTADLGRPRTSPLDCLGSGCDSMPDGQIISSNSGDGSVTETIRYALKAIPAEDSLGQVPAGQTTSVTKLFNDDVPSTGNPPQDLVENIQALEFLYNLSDGHSHTDPLNPAPACGVAHDLGQIRSITVSLLVTSRKIVHGFSGGQTCSGGTYYFPASNSTGDCSGKRWGPFNDSKIRTLIITNIQCRNMALRAED